MRKVLLAVGLIALASSMNMALANTPAPETLDASAVYPLMGLVGLTFLFLKRRK